jgi:hypothetical protein
VILKQARQERLLYIGFENACVSAAGLLIGKEAQVK